MSPEEEKALRELAQAGRQIKEIRGAHQRDPLGATLGDLDLNAESSLIKLRRWQNPQRVSEFPDFTKRQFVPFVRDNFYPNDHVAIGRLDYSSGPRPVMQQTILPAEELVSDRWQRFLRAANVHGQNIHISLNTFQPGGGRTKAELQEVRHVAIEIDHNGREAVDRIRTSGPPPHHVIESSPGKYHVWWRVQGFDPDRAEMATRGLIRTFGGDPAASDVTRMLRAPGFTNRKPEYSGQSLHWVKETGRSEKEIAAPYLVSSFTPYMEIGRERLQLPVREPGQSRTGHSRSEVDWAWTRDELRKGRDPGAVRAELAANRPDKPNPEYYAGRTVENAERSMKHDRPERGYGR